MLFKTRFLLLEFLSKVEFDYFCSSGLAKPTVVGDLKS